MKPETIYLHRVDSHKISIKERHITTRDFKITLDHLGITNNDKPVSIAELTHQHELSYERIRQIIYKTRYILKNLMS